MQKSVGQKAACDQNGEGFRTTEVGMNSFLRVFLGYLYVSYKIFRVNEKRLRFFNEL